MRKKTIKTILLSLAVFSIGTITIHCRQTNEVNSMDELKTAIAQAVEGTEIVLNNGNYSGEILISSDKGTKENPIIIRAKNQGKVLIESEIKIQGNNISLIGCGFTKQGSVVIDGKDCRLSHSTFSDSQAKKWVRVLPGSSNIEIDYNLFENKTNNTDIEKGCQLVQVIVRNQNEQHHIHHNLFKDIPPGKVSNGYETLQLITENNPFDPTPGNCNTVIENNMFIRCNGEPEVISVKSNGNTVRSNIFRACKGSMVFRHGGNNLATQNLFFGDGEPGSGGVRLQGTNQIVVNNYFQGLGQFGIGMMDGTPDDLYIRVERAQILFNTFVDCNNTMVIGLNHPKHPNGTPPKDCTVTGNIFYAKIPKPIFEFVQNDQPENWKWKDNIIFGGSTANIIEGIADKNPNLEFEKNILALPTSNTPKTDFASELAKLDLLGQVRTKETTIGAIQFPIEKEVALPLSEDVLGPHAK